MAVCTFLLLLSIILVHGCVCVRAYSLRRVFMIRDHSKDSVESKGYSAVCLYFWAHH